MKNAPPSLDPFNRADSNFVRMVSALFVHVSGPAGRHNLCRGRKAPVKETQSHRGPEGRHKHGGINSLGGELCRPFRPSEMSFPNSGASRPRQRLCRPCRA